MLCIRSVRLVDILNSIPVVVWLKRFRKLHMFTLLHIYGHFQELWSKKTIRTIWPSNLQHFLLSKVWIKHGKVKNTSPPSLPAPNLSKFPKEKTDCLYLRIHIAKSCLYFRLNKMVHWSILLNITKILTFWPSSGIKTKK